MLIRYYDEYMKVRYCYLEYDSYRILIHAQREMAKKEKEKMKILNGCWRD